MDCVGRGQFINEIAGKEGPQTRHIILPRPGYSTSHTVSDGLAGAEWWGSKIEKTARDRACAGKRSW